MTPPARLNEKDFMGMAFTTGLASLNRPVNIPPVRGIGGGPDGTGRGGGAAEAMRGIGGGGATRSEERRVGKEWRPWRWPGAQKPRGKRHAPPRRQRGHENGGA